MFGRVLRLGWVQLGEKGLGVINRRMLAVMALLSTSPALAQSSDWSGFYGGLFAGAAMGSGSLATAVDPVENAYFLVTSVDSIGCFT
jgi:hypothetical protein